MDETGAGASQAEPRHLRPRARPLRTAIGETRKGGKGSASPCSQRFASFSRRPIKPFAAGSLYQAQQGRHAGEIAALEPVRNPNDVNL